MSTPDQGDSDSFTRGEIALILSDHLRWVIDRTSGNRDEEMIVDLLNRFGIDDDLREMVLDVTDLTDP